MICPDAASWTYYHGTGCPDCQQTGFLGRTGIFEFLKVTGEVRKLIAEEKNDDELRKAAIAGGMQTLALNGLMKVKQGVTTLEEILHVTQQLQEVNHE